MSMRYKNMKDPFFSIVIPTYNRQELVIKAVKSVLYQDFLDYEIIISDNSFNDSTEKMCRFLNNDKIIYSKNKTNIGLTRNLYKAIKLAKGKYIFVLGDDDILLKSNILNNIHHLIQKKHYGYIRLKFIYQINENKLFSFYFKTRNKCEISGEKSNLEIYEFIESSIFNFISGLVFINLKQVRILKIEETNDPSFEMSDFWGKFIFAAVKQYGGYINYKDIILARWPEYSNPHFYDVINNRLPVESIWEMNYENLNDEEKKFWSAKKTEEMIRLFVSIKYYSNNYNLFFYVKRLLEINPKLFFSPLLYFFIFIAFLMPRLLWRFLRSRYQEANIVKDDDIIKSYNLLKKKFLDK